MRKHRYFYLTFKSFSLLNFKFIGHPCTRLNEFLVHAPEAAAQEQPEVAAHVGYKAVEVVDLELE